MVLARYLKYLVKPLAEREFVYDNYDRFLWSIAESSRYRAMPLRELSSKNPGDEYVAVSLRHDVDHDLSGALEMARMEHKYGVRGTYFILHSARYYGVTKRNYTRHNEWTLPVLRRIQDDYGHEIGWHNDLVTLECIYRVDPRKYLQEELHWLRDNGIEITGTAAHGSRYCRRFGYDNSHFFHDMSEDSSRQYRVIIHGNELLLTKADLRDFGLEYEAYKVRGINFLQIERRRWSPPHLRLADFVPGAKVVIVLHPIHWGRSIADKYRKLASLLLPDNLMKIHV
jgi:hypothetical protein